MELFSELLMSAVYLKRKFILVLEFRQQQQHQKKETNKTKHQNTHKKIQQIPIITCLEEYVKIFVQISSLENFEDILLTLEKIALYCLAFSNEDISPITLYIAVNNYSNT